MSTTPNQNTLDPNLLLALCAALQQQRVIPRFAKKSWCKKTLGTTYTDTAKYNYSAQEKILEWYQQQPVTEHLSEITGLSWAPDSGPITDIWTYWDGEDDTFTIHSLKGIEQCKKLQSIHVESLLVCDDLAPLSALPALKSIQCSDVVILASDANKRVIEALQKRGVQVTISSAKKDALTTGAKPKEPETIEIPPIAPEQCVELLNNLFPSLVRVVNPNATVDPTTMEKTNFTMPLFTPRRPKKELPDVTKMEAHYKGKNGAIQYHNFTSIVKRKDGTYSQADIRAMVHFIPNKTDLLEINMQAGPKSDPSKIERIYFSTLKLTEEQTQQALALVREAFKKPSSASSSIYTY